MILKIASDSKIESFDLIEFIRVGISISDPLGLYRLLRNFEDYKRKNGLKIEFFEALSMDSLLEASVGERLPDWIGLRETLLRLRSAEITHPISAIQTFDRELDIRDFIRNKKGFSGLERLYAIFDFIATGFGNGRFSDITSVIRYWRRMREFGVSFPQAEFHTEPGVQIMTAHQSKGLEYDVVFIPELIDGGWGNKKQTDRFPLPTSITGKKLDKESQNEEERRLFFVAITRAKKELFVSFPEAIKNKAVVMSEFLSDTGYSVQQNPLVAQPELLLVTRDTSLFSMKMQEEERAFLTNILRDYRLGPTDLSRFLDSPENFLQTVFLRYPFEDTPKTIFGTCYHAALEDFYIQWKVGKQIPSLEFLQEKFTRKIMVQPLSKEHKADAVERGKKGLEGFYN